MTVVSWPSDLPPFLREPYTASIGDTRVRKAADGVPGYKRRFSRQARSVSLGMELTRDQKAVFDLFFDQQTGGGNAVFTLPDPTLHGVTLQDGRGFAILTGGEAPIEVSSTWVCLFGDELPSETISGGRYVVTFNVWVLP